LTTQIRGNTHHYCQLTVGDPGPDFTQRSTSSPTYHFDTAAGRYIVLCFFGSAACDAAKRALSILNNHRKLFDDDKIAFFGISIDPDDEREERVKQSMPGIRYFWDVDGKISRLYGALPVEKQTSQEQFRPMWLVLNPLMRVLNIVPFREDHQDVGTVAKYLKVLPPIDEHAATPLHAPVLVLPRVFEPGLCDHLINLYHEHGGEESGFMREESGITVRRHDYGHKRRRDFNFDVQPEFEGLRGDIQRRVSRRIVPEVKKAFQFEITRMERYVVACYEGETGGFFRPHRDNTTKGTAHRRFACTINLNADDYQGGNLRFPEFGTKAYRAPTGGAIVFSCSLLHEATPVTNGRRYAFLPFFYDEAAKKIRDENLEYLEI